MRTAVTESALQPQAGQRAELLLCCDNTERSLWTERLARLCRRADLQLRCDPKGLEQVALVLLSMSMARRTLTNLVRGFPTAAIVVFGPDKASNALWCIRRGASEYVHAGLLADDPALLDSLLMAQLGAVARPPASNSRRCREAYRLARRAAPTDVPVFIQGPSGVGKEVLARFIHQHSLRSNGPFVTLNCAAVPAELLESTLFGHRKGAFTGADRRRDGKFLRAAGGTLLLDELTEMPVALQAKLLRAVQEREVEPLGASAPQPTNVRLIATSNRNLLEAVANGDLRTDLYYRLNVFPLALAALADRAEDILPLAEHFARRYQQGAPPWGTSKSAFHAEAQQALQQHTWPGNVRELENRVRRALILREGPQLQAAELGLDEPAGRPLAPPAASLRERLNAEEEALILNALRQHNGHRRATAQALGFSERTLRYRLSRLRASGALQ